MGGCLDVCMWETDRLRKIMLALWMGRGTDRPTSGARGHSHCASVGSVFESQLKQQRCNYTCPSRCPLNLPPLARCLWRPCCFCLFMSFSVFTFICLAFFFFFLVSHAFCDRAWGLPLPPGNSRQFAAAVMRNNTTNSLTEWQRLCWQANSISQWNQRSSKRAASQTPGLSLFRSLSP